MQCICSPSVFSQHFFLVKSLFIAFLKYKGWKYLQFLDQVNREQGPTRDTVKQVWSEVGPVNAEQSEAQRFRLTYHFVVFGRDQDHAPSLPRSVVTHHPSVCQCPCLIERVAYGRRLSQGQEAHPAIRVLLFFCFSNLPSFYFVCFGFLTVFHCNLSQFKFFHFFIFFLYERYFFNKRIKELTHLDRSLSMLIVIRM